LVKFYREGDLHPFPIPAGLKKNRVYFWSVSAFFYPSKWSEIILGRTIRVEDIKTGHLRFELGRDKLSPSKASRRAILGA
jgi:hypothetical protein